MFGTVDFGLDEWCNNDGIREGRVDAGGGDLMRAASAVTVNNFSGSAIVRLRAATAWVTSATVGGTQQEMWQRANKAPGESDIGVRAGIAMAAAL